jgi:hypothetical protein
MPKIDIAMFSSEIFKQIAEKSVHATCLIISLLPVPFLLYYLIILDLWKDKDWQFFFSGVSLAVVLCIFIYLSARVIAWLLYTVIVPLAVWLVYTAVHGLAWLLRTVIVPGTLSLLCVALPVVASLLYAALCSLALRLRDMGFRSARALGDLIAGAGAYPGSPHGADRPQSRP